jgi:hypothetical protein
VGQRDFPAACARLSLPRRKCLQTNSIQDSFTAFQIEVVNATFMKNGKLNEFLINHGPKVISNGIIKIRIGFFDDIDPKILLFDSYHESKHRDVEISALNI